MKKLIGLAIVLMSASAQADLICEGNSTEGGKIEIEVSKRRVTVKTDKMPETAIFDGVDNVWDGRMTGLITAPGLAIKYDNLYGCIRNVVAVTNVRRIPSTVDFIEVVTNLRCIDSRTPYECPPEGQ